MQFRILVAALLLGGVGTAFAVSATEAPEKKDDGTPLYTVVDGDKVDSQTYLGFKTWRAAACDRCHGANQEGLVGPSLIDSLKVLTKAEFVTTVTNGRIQKGMPPWKGNPHVMDNIDHLYAYLKGRSDGNIKVARVHEIQ